MKYILILSVLFLSSLCAAQTPSLYDDWTPNFAGVDIHINISASEISVTSPKSGKASFLPMTVPSENASELPMETSANKNSEKIEKCPVLKVTYDSLKAKGRIFFTEHDTKYISVLSFVIKDDGELVMGTAYTGHSDTTLKEAEERSVKPRKSNYAMNINFSLFNKTKVAEFNKLKNPTEMTTQEALSMIGSLGDRLAALLQKDTSSYGYEMYGLMYGNGQRIIQDLFIAHGYNPLNAGPAYEKFEKDEQVQAAFKLLEKKLQESTPALREAAKYRHQADYESKPTDSMMTPAPPTPAPVQAEKNTPTANYPGEVTEMKKESIAPSQEARVDGEDFIDITSEPKPTKNIQALVKYPIDAKKAGVEGKVTYSVLIDKDGKVLKVVIDHSDNEIFNQAVIDAVKKVRFTPAMQGKKAIKVWYSQSVTFKLN